MSKHINTKLKKETSLFRKIVFYMIITIIVLFVFTGIFIGGIVFNSSKNTLLNLLSETSTAYTQLVGKDIIILNEQMKSIANHVISLDTGINSQKTNDILDSMKKDYNFTTIYSIEKNGDTHLPDINVKDRDYFQKAINGEFYLSSPFLKTDGNIGFTAAIPIYDDSNIVGIVSIGLDYKYFSNFIQFDIGKTGQAYIIDKHGNMIAHRNTDYVKDFFNPLDDKNSSTKSLKEAFQKFILGDHEMSTYVDNNISKIAVASSILNTDGWILVTTLNNSEVISTSFFIICILIVIVILGILIGTIVSLRLAKGISEPIQMIGKRFKLLSEGDLKTDVPKINTGDEVEALALDLNTTVTNLSSYIQQITFITNNICNYDLSKKVEQDFLGDFQPIKTSLNGILSMLNSSLGEINIVADQVSSGSEHVSGGAQALAEGTTEQATAIEYLSTSINEIYSQIKQDALNASKSNEFVIEAGKKLKSGNEKMSEMLSAIDKISKSSKEIGDIIKTIDDIANQTNLLSLNASIEAARAGEAGKGFVVVADEVRKLATKSGEAVKNTTILIESSIKAIENGTKISNETASTLIDVMKNAEESAILINEISTSSNKEADSISNITSGTEQISSVIQANASTAQQSSATSEELSCQAQTLKNLVGKFNLKK